MKNFTTFGIWEKAAGASIMEKPPASFLLAAKHESQTVIIHFDLAHRGILRLEKHDNIGN